MKRREAHLHSRERGSAVATEASREAHRHWPRFPLAVLALVWASTGIAQPQVHPTGYEVGRVAGPWPSLHWIDNDRLLFAGMKTADMAAAIARKEPNREERFKKLYLWAATTNAVTAHADASAVCVAGGVVRYTVRVDRAAGKLVEREGVLGSEKEVEKPLPTADAVRSKFTCREHLRQGLTPPAPRFRQVVVLREGDGYLDLGPGGGEDYFEQRRTHPRTLRLYQGRTGRAIELPVTWEEEIAPAQVAYSEYRQAYVLQPQMPRGSQLGRITRWPSDRRLLVYLVSADGHLETVTFPYRPAEHLIDPRPTRNGWILGGGTSPKTVALYLFDGAAVKKIESGFVREIAVSPDGCKAAVGIQDKPYEMGTPVHLKILGLCGEGR